MSSDPQTAAPVSAYTRVETQSLPGQVKLKYHLVFLIAVVAVCLLFLMISTGTSQLRVTSFYGVKGEYTFWVSKNTAGGVTVTVSSIDGACATHRGLLLGGGAFSIIGIFALMASLATGILEFLEKPLPAKHMAAFAAAGACFCAFLCWVFIAVLYNVPVCGLGIAFKSYGVYGPGFGLMVTVWLFLAGAVSVYMLRVNGTLPALQPAKAASAGDL